MNQSKNVYSNNKKVIFGSAKTSNTANSLPPILKKRRHRNAQTNEKLKEFESDSFFWNSSDPNNELDGHNSRVRTYINGPGPGKYARPTSIGHLNHDITIKTEPAFTMCKAERFIDRYDYSRDVKSSSSYWNRSSAEENFQIKPTSAYLNGPGPGKLLNDKYVDYNLEKNLKGKYLRPTSIGYPNTDVTLMNPPAYSIGRAERTIDLNASPFFALPRSSGSDFSNGTPGPAHYYYEKYENKYKNQVPAYSIGKAQRFPTIIV